MKVFDIIRSQEWWSHKLPPILAIGYATSLMSRHPIYQNAFWLLILLTSLIVGAVYVSVINDITDLDEDLASGKSNRIQQIPPKMRWIVPGCCLLIGLIYGYCIYPDILSCILYLCSWVTFSLYSIKPFRLKNRGFLGVIADCCGSHLFPSLLMVSSVSHSTHQDINWYWFSFTGLWAFCYGLRGILWHQFSDRDNDIKVNLNTYAVSILPSDFKTREWYLFTIEMLALLIMLLEIRQLGIIISLGLYAILVILRYCSYKNKVSIILTDQSKPYQILMADFYQMFFPVGLLILGGLMNPKDFIVLGTHLLLFPYLVYLAFYDYAFFSRTVIRRIR